MLISGFTLKCSKSSATEGVKTLMSVNERVTHIFEVSGKQFRCSLVMRQKAAFVGTIDRTTNISLQ